MAKRRKKKNNKRNIAIISLLIAGAVIIALFSGVFSVFTPTTITAQQFVGNLEDDSIPQIASLPNSLGSSSVAVLGDYKIVTETAVTYGKWGGVRCRENTCGGELIDRDDYACGIWQKSGTTTTTRSCESTSQGYICGFNGCGYYSGTCQPNTAGCDSTISTSVTRVPPYVTCTNGQWNGIDMCQSGDQSNVKYTRTAPCYNEDVTCGGKETYGGLSPAFDCANKYKIYYQDELVEEVKGLYENSDYIIGSANKFLYFFQGGLSDGQNADLIMNLRSSNLFVNDPRRCALTTNDFDVPVSENAFEVNITRNVNLEQGQAEIILDITNYYSELDGVWGNVEIEYSTLTALGSISDTVYQLISIPRGTNTYTIDIPNEVAIDRINMDVKLDILRSASDFSGINIPSYNCFGYNGNYAEAGTGAMKDVGSCYLVKIGESSESFSLDVVQELKDRIDELNQQLQNNINEVNRLEGTIQEKAQLIQQLEQERQRQLALILEYEGTLEEQAQLLQELEFSVEEQAQYLRELEANLQTKAQLISQLTVENDEQAQLIAQMRLSFSDQAEIIDALDLTIQDDARIIAGLTGENNAQIEIIANLHRTIEEKEQIIRELNLSVTEEQRLIQELRQKIVDLEQGQTQPPVVNEGFDLLTSAIIGGIVGVILFILLFLLTGKSKRRKK